LDSSDFDYNPDQTTYIRVNAGEATSANNAVELDGNNVPGGTNGVEPNGDNYTFTTP